MAIHFILIVGHDEETTNYRKAVSASNYLPIVTDSLDLLYEAENKTSSHLPLLSYIDLLILPGGGDISPNVLDASISPDFLSHTDELLDHVQLSYFSYFYQHKKPVIGICKGMQLINCALGGTLIYDLSDDRKLLHTRENSFDKQHSCNYEINDDIALLKYVFKNQSPNTVNSAHHQAIHKLGDDLYAFSHASDGTIEGIIHKDLPIIGLQWHPERKLCPNGNYLKVYILRLLQFLTENPPEKY